MENGSLEDWLRRTILYQPLLYQSVVTSTQFSTPFCSGWVGICLGFLSSSLPQALVHFDEQMSGNVRHEIFVEPVGRVSTPPCPLAFVESDEQSLGSVVVRAPERDLGPDMVSVRDFSVVHVSGVAHVVPDEGGEVMLDGVVAVEGRFVGIGNVVEGD